MKISICISVDPTKFSPICFSDDLSKNLQIIKEMGFDGVELAIKNPSLVDLTSLNTELKLNGLEVSAISTGQAWNEDGLSYTNQNEAVRYQAIDRTLSHIPFAAKHNAIIIIGLLRGRYSDTVDKTQVYAWMKEAFKICCFEAKKKNVKIALEAINRYEVNSICTVKEGLSFIEDIGMENLGLLLDTFHMNIEEPNIEESIRMAGDRIFHFHYADSNRWYPGAGHLDFYSILNALYSVGYKGFLSGEHLPNPNPENAAFWGLEYIRYVESNISKNIMRLGGQ